MLKRTITGAGIVGVVYLVLLYSHKTLVFVGAMTVLNCMAVYELFHAANMIKCRKVLATALTWAAFLSLVPITEYDGFLCYVFLAASMTFLWLMLRQEHCSFDEPGKVFWIALLVTALFRSVPAVRELPNGFYYLTFAITLCFITDIMAYLVGKAIGKHKLCLKISPNKTVEGSLAGILGAVLCMFLLGKWMEVHRAMTVRYGLLLLYAILAALAGEFGDLAMSSFKRVCGVKDFGKLFPGHGGMLDRFDSQMFAVAFTLLFCTVTGGYLG